jgi:hypothetical protein
MGDWVPHPSNTVARGILVTYPLLAAVSGEGSLGPPGIKMNSFILCPTIIVFRINNSTEFILCPMIIIFPITCFLPPLAEGSCKPKVQVQDALWSHCKPGIKSLSRQQKWSLFNDHVQQDRRPASKIDVCVCDFAYLVMKVWPRCNLNLMYQ